MPAQNLAIKEHPFSLKNQNAQGVIRLVEKPEDIDQETARMILVESFVGEYLRTLQPHEIDSKLTTWRRGENSVEKYYRAYFRTELTDFAEGRLSYWVEAKVDGKLVGFATFQLEKSSKDNPAAYMNLLAVHPDYQRMGIGTQLVHALSKLNIVPDLNAIHILLRTKNQGGRKFYEKIGFNSNPNYQRKDNYVDRKLLEPLSFQCPADKAALVMQPSRLWSALNSTYNGVSYCASAVKSGVTNLAASGYSAVSNMHATGNAEATKYAKSVVQLATPPIENAETFVDALEKMQLGLDIFSIIPGNEDFDETLKQLVRQYTESNPIGCLEALENLCSHPIIGMVLPSFLEQFLHNLEACSEEEGRKIIRHLTGKLIMPVDLGNQANQQIANQTLSLTTGFNPGMLKNPMSSMLMLSIPGAGLVMSMSYATIAQFSKFIDESRGVLRSKLQDWVKINAPAKDLEQWLSAMLSATLSNDTANKLNRENVDAVLTLIENNISKLRKIRSSANGYVAEVTQAGMSAAANKIQESLPAGSAQAVQAAGLDKLAKTTTEVAANWVTNYVYESMTTPELRIEVTKIDALLAKSENLVRRLRTLNQNPSAFNIESILQNTVEISLDRLIESTLHISSPIMEGIGIRGALNLKTVASHLLTDVTSTYPILSAINQFREQDQALGRQIAAITGTDQLIPEFIARHVRAAQNHLADKLIALCQNSGAAIAQNSISSYIKECRRIVFILLRNDREERYNALLRITSEHSPSEVNRLKRAFFAKCYLAVSKIGNDIGIVAADQCYDSLRATFLREPSPPLSHRLLSTVKGTLFSGHDKRQIAFAEARRRGEENQIDHPAPRTSASYFLAMIRHPRFLQAFILLCIAYMIQKKLSAIDTAPSIATTPRV